MANLILKFLTLLILIYAGTGYFDPVKGNNITLGSKLFPQNISSWLSPSGTFAFGFYKKADGFAVGIWLQTKTPDPVVTWTANRDDPPIPSDAYLELSREGRLLLWTKQSVGDILYNLTKPATSASLLDSGNLVFFNGSNVLWESFDYPTDTILGGQVVPLGYTFFSSVSATDQSRGRFILEFQGDGNLVAYPVNVTSASSYSYWSTRTFGWTNGREQLVLTERGHLYLNLTSRINDSVHTIAQSSYNQSQQKTVYRATFDIDGNFRLYLHIFESSGNSTMKILWYALQNLCEVKGHCGVNAYCSFDASTGNNCFCFPGFIYFEPEKKFLGCYRNFTYERFCGRKETSQPYNYTVLMNMSIGGYSYGKSPVAQEECGPSCMNDCNCWAALYKSGDCNKYRHPILYATQGKNQSGIAFIKQSHNSSQSAEANAFLEQRAKKVGKRKRKMILILAPPFGFLSVLFTLLAVFSFLLYRKRALRYQRLLDMENLGLNKEFTLRSFSYNELERATDGFKREVGRNSYGKIYEGTISEGNRKVSVKRLEKFDAEPEGEFTAEMTVMGRIHHKNVVQLVGFCIEGVKKLLVYEFMTNRSLVDVIYKVDRRPFWKERMRLAVDIAQGLRYLHEDCDTRVVHCNIKPRNILVDDNWTAKISNFGSAKLLAPNQTENMVKEREERGYSAPEWHKTASISEKVDVYSYGLVLLETICCTSDLIINVESPDEPFPSKVYRYFKTKELRNLIGDEDVDMESLERMIKVGLCCIQKDPDLRPPMKNVILMLEGTLDAPIPFPPTFSQALVTPT
ncbi:G-type lectin S-receptor-like serine/threonine-protein kinase LECRK1 [Coffea eugenioides]|uniref:Receptor-like serine/threonine-protein kinase n=1 Tax=Coffea arabica TaxID=13443 RepID=A0A6P6TEK5_COFAR|nr:G-type lectin S-receptor-like serine/threonine-protein kinase LECRK1 [Coffea arabica]XP_027177744.1 G-type lectin S-receptor-like serine/threonine-protein kinase LECRK1 [Coffea eugenioides]